MLTQKLLQVSLLGAEWVLWLLIALSVVSVGVILERVWFFLRGRLKERQEVEGLILSGELDAAGKKLATERGLEAEVLRAGLERAKDGPESVEAALTAAMVEGRLAYETNLAFLGTVGNNAPFVGLLGTVLGIIRAFADLAAAERAGPQVVMGGISEALVATAVGIAVAIPAVVAFNSFQRWIKSIASRSEALGHVLVSQLRAQAGGRPTGTG